MASFADGNPAAVPWKFVVAEALTQLGGSSARYDVKLVAGGYRTYVESYIPVSPGSAEAVLVRCAGGVSRELTVSEDSGADAFVGMLKDRFGELVDDEEELRAKVLDRNESLGSVGYECSMTFEVEDLSTPV